MPVPKVIDFGIAKATQQELTDKTVFTQFQQFIGTPAYISPEQAEMSGLDIDTRADIYSLGVLLYELLVGQTPFDAKEMMQGGLDALRQIIREKEPLRPSTKLNTLPGDARTTAGKRRQTDVGKLVHQLQGDLDWIVMKCLEKDRTRRYETANGLAVDIQRHLNNEPVVGASAQRGLQVPEGVAAEQAGVYRRRRLSRCALLLGVGGEHLASGPRDQRRAGARKRRPNRRGLTATARCWPREIRHPSRSREGRRDTAGATPMPPRSTLAFQALAENNLGRAIEPAGATEAQARRRGPAWLRVASPLAALPVRREGHLPRRWRVRSGLFPGWPVAGLRRR